MMPASIGGKREEEKPTVVIGLGMSKKPKLGMPKMIGGSGDDEEPEGDEEKVSNEQAKDDATDEIISALGGSKQSHDRLKSALEAFFYACDAEPHDEGEHTEEESEEPTE